ncbi:hypothetical protein [Mycobacteroides abscessus]|uniref:hypothetical protein n=1 Tax=Mycobacteroides abscessus TaxID=36809 RepID=UPI0027DEE728|nr:hypothetical protein [Mycobacteroides abscessus]
MSQAGVRRAAVARLHRTCSGPRYRIKSGANIKVVQKLLGHKSAVLTLDRYGHLFPDDLDAVADAFDTASQIYCGRTADGTTPQRNQAPSRGGLTSVAGAGFEPA